MIRRALLLAALALAGRAAPVLAVCPAAPLTNVCSAAQLSACCGTSTCDIDGSVTIRSGAICALDFGNRRLRLLGAGRIVLGSSTLELRAASVEIGSGRIDAGGVASPGTLQIVTTGRATAPAAAVAITALAGRIDLSGTDAGGALIIRADGAVRLATGQVAVDGTGVDGDAGSIDIDTTGAAGSAAGDVLLAARITADSGPFGRGADVRIHAARDLTLDQLLSARGGFSASSVDLRADGALSLTTRAQLLASAAPTSSGDGGDVFVEAGTITVQSAAFHADGDGADATGGIVMVAAHRGTLTVASSEGITANGDEGEIQLLADSIEPGGNIVLNGPLSASPQSTVDAWSAGGSIAVEATGDITVLKRINASGLGGGAGDIDLSAGGTVSVANAIVASDPSEGGALRITSGRATSFSGDGDVNLRGTADGDGDGGSVFIAAGDTVSVSSGLDIDVTGSVGDGGTFTAFAQGNITLGGAVAADTSSATAKPGTIQALAGTRCAPDTLCPSPVLVSLLGPTTTSDVTGDIAVTGNLTATSSAGTGGQLFLAGCNVTISGVANASGDIGDTLGTNVIVARKALTVGSSARVRARRAGGNQIHLPAGAPRSIAGGAIAPTPVIDETHPRCSASATADCLRDCPACGDGIRELQEECDPGQPATHTCLGDTDCTIHCRVVSCIDANPCTDDTCDPVHGCRHTVRLGADIDGCDDHDACNGAETCAFSSGPGAALRCQRGTAPDCDDGNPCTDDCNPAAGCVPDQPYAQPPACEDGNFCNGTETCVGTTCTPGTPVTCEEPGDACTPSDGVCRPIPCTPGQSPSPCDDGNPCTVDTCDALCAAGVCCRRTVLAGTGIAGCDDGEPCNGAELCSAGGVCQHPGALDCDDGNPCTADRCELGAGCQHDRIAGCCETNEDCQPDADPCTAELGCVDHACANAPVANCCLTDGDCDDDNPCTDDGVPSCDLGAHQCREHIAIDQAPRPGCGTPCAPGLCTAGTCIATPLDCTAILGGDDGDLCTEDVCDPFDTDGSPCARHPIPNCCHATAECDDGRACTEDACNDHRCSNLYTTPGCPECDVDPRTDMLCSSRCAPDPEACIDHRCRAVAPVDCDDGNPETIDRCVADATGQPGCTHRCGPATCDDGNACTIDTCDPGSGSCGHAAVDCPAGDLCSLSSCDPSAGCVRSDRTGLDAVTCHLDMIDAALAASNDVAAPLRRRLATRLRKLRATLAKAAAAQGGRPPVVKRLLASTARQFRALGRMTIAAARKRRPQIPRVVADTLLAQLDAASAAVSGAITP